MQSPTTIAPLVRILLLLVLAAAVYFFSGFLVPVLAALIIGFASWPLYERLLRTVGGSTIWGASIALVVILVVLVVPLSFALYYAVTEAVAFVEWLLLANRQGVAAPDWVLALPLVGDEIAKYWNTYLGKPQALGDWVQAFSGQHIGDIYRIAVDTTTNVASIMLTVLFMLIALFSSTKTARLWQASLIWPVSACCPTAGSISREWCRLLSARLSPAWA